MPSTEILINSELTSVIQMVIFFTVIIAGLTFVRRLNSAISSVTQKRLSISLLLFGLFVGFFFILDFTFVSHQIAVALFLIVLLISISSLIKNFFYGLIIFLKRTITIDDSIEINGIKGVVYKINFTTTVVYTNESSYVHIPNSEFFKRLYTKESGKEEQYSAFIQFDLSFKCANLEDLTRVAKLAVITSIYVDTSRPNEVTVKQIHDKDELKTIHVKLHILSSSFNERAKSDLLIRINQNI